MDQLLFTEVCLEMAYLDFLGSVSLASLLPPCCLHSETEIMAMWEELLALLTFDKEKLERYSVVISLQREIETPRVLEDSLSFYQLIQDLEEEGQWCNKKLLVR